MPPDSPAPVRIALVGYGLGGRIFHAPFIEACAGTELVAVVTSDPGRRAQVRAAHPGAVLFGEAGEVWPAAAELGIEVVVVAVPNRAHVAVAEAALDAGLGVVVDKPLAPSAAEGRRLIEDAGRRGRLLTVFHNRRWDGDFLTVRRLVDAGALGDVWRLESRYERWRPERRPDSWKERADPEDAGGLLADLGSHLIDQATQLLGPPVAVYAELRRRRPGTEVDDDTFVALEHAGGATSHLWASSVAARPGPRFRVLGSRAGYAIWDMDPQEQALHAGLSPAAPEWGRSPADRRSTAGAGDEVGPVPVEAGDYGRFYEGLAACVRDGAPPPVAPADALLTLDVIDAARRSAAAGGPVGFPAG